MNIENLTYKFYGRVKRLDFEKQTCEFKIDTTIKFDDQLYGIAFNADKQGIKIVIKLPNELIVADKCFKNIEDHAKDYFLVEIKLNSEIINKFCPEMEELSKKVNLLKPNKKNQSFAKNLANALDIVETGIKNIPQCKNNIESIQTDIGMIKSIVSTNKKITQENIMEINEALKSISSNLEQNKYVVTGVTLCND